MADSYRVHADSTPPPASDGQPLQIGRYEVIGQIGSGGMARAYLAAQRDPHPRLVAVKLLRPEVMEETELRDMFRNEARVSVLLHHPNVVRTFEVGSTDQLYLVLEYLEGQSLGSLYRQIPRKDVPTLLQIYILTEVLAGLEHAHTLHDLNGSPLSLVHRDISPSNIFLTTDGEVKVLDFGIAKVAGSQTITRAGTVKGKLGYAAPEQLMGTPVDCRADIFAVGTLLWEALAGRRRVVAETVSAVTFARIQGQEINLEDVSPETPEVLRKICARALATETEGRYPTAEAMRADLMTFLSKQPAVQFQTQLARLISDTFEPELAARRRAIAEHLVLGSSRSATTIPGVDAPDGPASQRTPTSERYVSGAPASARDLASIRDGLSHSVHAAPARKNWQAPVLISSAILLSIGLVFAARIHGGRTVTAAISHRTDAPAEALPSETLPVAKAEVAGASRPSTVQKTNTLLHAGPDSPVPAAAVEAAPKQKPESESGSARAERHVTQELERTDSTSKRSKRRRDAESASAPELTRAEESVVAQPAKPPSPKASESPVSTRLKEASPGDTLTRQSPRRPLRTIDEVDPYQDAK